MTKNQNSKIYDLEERTFQFSKNVIQFIHELPKTIPDIEIAKQLIRSAGSIGANYIEANESLSRKDFIMGIKICRKESKETRYWLKLLEPKNLDSEKVRQALVNEATELMKIFGAILEKSKIV